jgi:hypothetical protein
VRELFEDARKENPCACTPTPTQRGSASTRPIPRAATAAPEARMHARREPARGEAQLRRRVPGEGPRLPRDRALLEGLRQAQGVGGADVRRTQGVARDEEVQAQEALAGERRSAGDGRGTEHKAAAHSPGQGTEEVGTGSGSATSGTYHFGERPTFEEPSSSEIHTTLASFSTCWGLLRSWRSALSGHQA